MFECLHFKSLSIGAAEEKQILQFGILTSWQSSQLYTPHIKTVPFFGPVTTGVVRV